MKKIILYCTAVFLILSGYTIKAQVDNSKVQIGTVGEKISDFRLTSLQGKDVIISDYVGKNIILVFPRGKVLDNVWCAICHYQYAELADMENNDQFRTKFNVEVLYVLPYVKDSVIKWSDAFQDRLNAIERWKNPKEPEKLSEGQKAWMDFCRKAFPNKYEYPASNVNLPFPVLMDADHTVSKGFGLLREEWDGTKTQQNVPTIFIIDKTGTIRFKYHSQTTADRPNAKYLIEFIEKML